MSATRFALAALVLCLSAVSAQDSKHTYDGVASLLKAAKDGAKTYKVLLRNVLVVTDPDDVDDDEHYLTEFYVQDYVRVNGQMQLKGEALRVRIESYYFGHNPWEEDSDDPHEEDVALSVKKGDVISLAGELDKDWDDDAYELTRTLEEDLYDDDLYEVYAEGWDLEDYTHARSVLSMNYGIDDLDDFSADSYGGSGDPAAELKEFNEILVAHKMKPITKADEVETRYDELSDVDHGIRAPITIHKQGVKPVVLTPRVSYMRPYSKLRQGGTTVIKVTNAGAFPNLQLDDTGLTIVERLPGLLMIEIPESVSVGKHELRVSNEGKTSEPFNVWIKAKLEADNPAPVLDSATVVGSNQAAVLVLEGNHFSQSGGLSVYLGRYKISKVLHRSHRTAIVEIEDGKTGNTARVRVGRLRSNSVKVHGNAFLKARAKAKAKAKAGAKAPGINDALGGDK